LTYVEFSVYLWYFVAKCARNFSYVLLLKCFDDVVWVF